MNESPAQTSLRLQVRAELNRARISQASACRQLGVSTKHMSKMLSGKSTLTLNWAEQILALCGKQPVITLVRNTQRSN